MTEPPREELVQFFLTPVPQTRFENTFFACLYDDGVDDDDNGVDDDDGVGDDDGDDVGDDIF